MWNEIKRGLGYGFGGRIGWELGGLLWRTLRRIVLLVFAALASLGFLASLASHGHGWLDNAQQEHQTSNNTTKGEQK